MKLSAVVLLTVNLVAASQVAANASDTASFLQDALAPSAKAAKSGEYKAPEAPRTIRSDSRKKSSSYMAMAPVLDGVKLRPFVPGRYLPSESELQAKKQAETSSQQPVFSAGNASGMLSGQVSTTNNTMSELSSIVAPAASYAMSRPVNQDYIQKIAQIALKKVKQASKNFVAEHPQGTNPLVPNPVAQLAGLRGGVPEVPEPQATVSTSMPVPQPQARPINTVKVPQYNAASSVPVVQPPELTKYEANQLEKLVDSNLPENVYAQGQGTAGQSPLAAMPLSQGRGRPINTAVSQARFGSWHGGNLGLTSASFHTYVPIHMAGPMSVKINQHSISHHTGHQSAGISAHTFHAGLTTKESADKHKADTFVADYPPYRRYSLYK